MAGEPRSTRRFGRIDGRPVSPVPVIRFAWVALVSTLFSACEAGPSAFDRSVEGADSPPVAVDSAVVSSAGTEAAGASAAVSGPAAAGGPSTEGVGAEGTPASGGSTAAVTGPVPETASETTVRAEVAGGPEVREVRQAGTRVGSTAGRSARADGSARFPRPEAIRGLYLNAWASGSRNRTTSLIELAGRTEINSFVIDIKDATGFISHPTELPMAREVGADGEVRIRDLPGLLARLEEAGIYPIARIVVIKDPLLAGARPDLAIQDTAGGVWVDSKGFVWLNPYNKGVWDYHVDLAREVAEMGFPEIQWDYVRFPDVPASDHARARYPGSNGRVMADAIRDFLKYSQAELAEIGVSVTADVFGVTTSARRDVGIGQVWESFIDVVDAALPMVYPSHYWKGSFGIATPNAYPYEIVKGALRDAVRRSEVVDGAGSTRPWLQDFTLGKPRYEAPEVRAQIQAAYDVGINEWILWNPGSSYTEEALEPVGGFVTEPLMRVAGQIVPVSRRWALLDTATARAPEQAGAGADTSAGRTAAIDTIGVGR